MTSQAATAEKAEIAEIIPPEHRVSGGVPALRDDAGAEVALVQDDEWSDVSDGDLVPAGTTTAGIPRLVVNRKSDGGFVNETTGEMFRSLDCVLMARSHTRAWWPLPFGKGDAEPSCRSNDGVVPTPESPAQQPDWTPPKGSESIAKPARECAVCPHSQWDGDNPPTCALAMEAMIGVPNLDEHAVELYRLRFSGMGYGPARRYWETFSARLPKRPPIAFVSRITLAEETTPNGVFLRPKFERLHELTRDQARPLIDERDRRLGEWQEEIATAPVVDDDLSASPSTANDAPPEDEEPF